MILWIDTDILEEPAASFFRNDRICSQLMLK